MNTMRNQKLSQEEWLEIEVDFSDYDLRVCSMMLEAGSLFPQDQAPQLQFDVLGEELYLELFHKRVQNAFREEKSEENSKKTKGKEKDKGKKQGKPGTKGAKKGKNDVYEKYKQTEKRKKIEDGFNELLEANADALFRQKNFGFSSNVLEFRLLAFLVLAKLVKEKEEWAYEIIIGLKKCLHAYKEYKGNLLFVENPQIEIVSQTLVSEVTCFMESLMEKHIFSMRITFIRYPKLVYHTIFDPYFKSIQLQPYKSQKELLRGIRNFCLDPENKGDNKGLLVFYKAMIGSGKTTVALALASVIMQLREQKPKIYGNLQVLFCCGLAQIRVQVGQLAFNALQFQKLTFGVASSGENNSVIYRNHFSCKDAKNPVLIITDLETTASMLRNTQKKYLLFLDEPIIDADQEKSPITETFLEIMKYAPNISILSSATLPNPEDLPHLVDLFRKRHEHSEVFTIQAEQAKIAQQIHVDFNEKYYPHTGCKDVPQLRTVIDAVKKSPFLGRLYTGPSLWNFEEKIGKLGIKKRGTKGIEQRFGDPRYMNQNAVQEYVFEILEAVLETNDNVKIASFCQEEEEVIMAKSLTEEKEEEETIPMNKEEEKTMETLKKKKMLAAKGFKWEHLASRKAHVFIGGCLIATPEPLVFARRAFGKFVAKVSFKGILKDFRGQMEVFEGELKKFEEIKNEEERLKKRSAYENENTPRMPFPEHMKINLKAHLLRYSDLEKPELVGYRKDFLLEDLVFNIEEDINLMLFSGVGVFDSEKIPNNDYNKSIRSKAKFGELAYLVSNKDILYGANYPLNSVLIKDSFAGFYSISTIFQTMGRAGRIGQAWKSNCFIGQKVRKLLENYIRDSCDPNYISPEARNIEQKIGKSFYEEKIVVDAVKKMRKICICFNKDCLSGVFSMVCAAIFYLQKISKNYRPLISDFDLQQIVSLKAVETFDELELTSLKGTVYCLGVFPFTPKQNLQEIMNDCRKLVYIDNEAKDMSKYDKFRKECGVQGVATKFLEIFDKRTSCAELSYQYFRTKAEIKGFLFSPIVPNYVKKRHNQAFSPSVFETFIKVVGEAEVNHSSSKSREIMARLSEKVKNYVGNGGLKLVWKVATLQLEKLKLRSNEIFLMLKDNLQELFRNIERIVILSNGLKVYALMTIPIKNYWHRNFIRLLAMDRANELGMKRVVLICWGSYMNMEEVLVGVYSDEAAMQCGDLFNGLKGKDSEIWMGKKEVSTWKLEEFKK